MEYRYIGCFIESEALHAAIAHLPAKRLFRVIAHPHVTFAYMPAQVDRSLFGQKLTVTVTGYGCDGKNEGLYVSVHAKHAALQAMADAIAVPHITVSVSETGKPVDTAQLEFLPTSPFSLTGIFGGYLPDGTVDTNGKSW